MELEPQRTKDFNQLKAEVFFRAQMMQRAGNIDVENYLIKKIEAAQTVEELQILNSALYGTDENRIER